LPPVQGCLFDLFGLHLGLLAFLLGLEFVKAPVFGQLHLPQHLGSFRSPGICQEIPVFQSTGGRQPLEGIQFQEFLDQVDGTGCDMAHFVLVPLPELGPLSVNVSFEADFSRSQQLEIVDARPGLEGGGSHHVEYEL